MLRDCVPRSAVLDLNRSMRSNGGPLNLDSYNSTVSFFRAASRY